MKSKKIMLSVLSFVATAGLVGCGGQTSSATNSTNSTNGNSTSANPYSERVDLNLSVYYDNDDRHMKFIEGAAAKLPYASLNKKTYKADDFKPVWESLQKNLNFRITDLSPNGSIAINKQFETLVSQSFKVDSKPVHVAQGNSDQILEEGTAHDTIINFNDYLDQMPNFKKFLTDNPAVKKIISSADGKVFYAPYFDGYDDVERMLMVRQDWVEKLLDGETLPTNLDTTAVAKNYTPFYPDGVNVTFKVLNDAENGTENFTKSYTASQNIIKQFNDTADLTGAKAVELLRNYIDTVYGTKYGTKRSKLFLGGKAAYDVDELVALFKCVKANSKFLTGSATTKVIPLFPRAKTSDRTADLYRFLQFFGLRGVESRKEQMYVDKDGKLNDVRNTDSYLTGIKKLREMYQDGLIFENFTEEQINNKDDYRGPLLTDGSAQLGFATYDYNQTTTVYNDSNKDLKFVSVLPAMADFDMDGSKDSLQHYTESWRSVKPQGWFITKQTTGAQLTRALALVDYLYSEEGNRLMSYGPDEYLAKNEDGSIKMMDYQGKQVPVLSDACKKEMKDLAGGNYTNYYRYYLGATLPVGYVKEQGMEFQTVSSVAVPSLETLNHAIQYGVLNHPNHKSGNTNHLNDIVPVTLPFTKAENTAISTNFKDLQAAYPSDKKKAWTVSKVVISGFGTYDNYDLSEANFMTTMKTTFKLTDLVKFYNDAYTRFLNLQ